MMPRSLRSGMKLIALVITTAIAGRSLAHAGDKVDPGVQRKADKLFEKAQASYEAGSYQESIALFKQAYELVHDPVYLFNVAQSYRKILDCEGSAEYYTRYLSESPNAENRAKVEQWLREIRPCVEQRQHEHEAAQRAEKLERERREEQARLAKRPVETVVDRGAAFRVTGIVVGAAGIVAVGVGVGYSLHGGSLKHQLADTCAIGCTWDSVEIQQLDADGRNANTYAKVGYITGGVAAIAGVALYAFGRARIEHVMVAPIMGGGATVSAQLRF